MTEDQTPAPKALEPTEGGSYVRDPETGALTRAESETPASEPAADAPPAAG
jgi:hypothetical protein